MYIFSYFVVTLLSISILLMFLYIKRFVIMLDSGVLAYNESPWILLSILPIISFMIISILLLKIKYEQNIPLFEKKEKVTFSNTKSGQLNKKIVVCFCMVFLFINVFAIILPFSAKTLLTQQGDIIKYGLFNQQQEHIAMPQYTNINIGIHHHIQGVYTSEKYILTISFKTENSQNDFNLGAFRDLDTAFAFLTNIPYNVLTVTGEENLDIFLKTSHLSKQQEELLRNIIQETQGEKDNQGTVSVKTEEAER